LKWNLTRTPSPSNSPDAYLGEDREVVERAGCRPAAPARAQRLFHGAADLAPDHVVARDAVALDLDGRDGAGSRGASASRTVSARAGAAAKQPRRQPEGRRPRILVTRPRANGRLSSRLEPDDKRARPARLWDQGPMDLGTCIVQTPPPAFAMRPSPLASEAHDGEARTGAPAGGHVFSSTTTPPCAVGDAAARAVGLEVSSFPRRMSCCWP
jgi:hypothetical protein